MRTLAVFLALAAVLALAFAAPVKTQTPPEPAAVQAPGPDPEETDIVVAGKLYCSLKRQVNIPFHGFVTQIHVKAGQKVAEGDPIIHYRLAPDVALELKRRTSPYSLKEQELQLNEVRRNLKDLQRKARQVRQLAQSALAPAQSIHQINSEIDSLKRKEALLEGQVELARSLLEDDLDLLSRKLGQEIKPGHVPTEAALTSPISGHVVRINPMVVPRAELPPGAAVAQVGVLDPMILRAQVHEIEATQLEVGDPAKVVLESMPGADFKATVTGVSWTPASLQLGQPSYYTVEFSAPNEDLKLKEGFTGKIFINPPQ